MRRLRTSLGSGSSFQSTEGLIAQLEAQAAEASTSQATDVSVQEELGDDNEDAVDMGDETEDDEEVRGSLFLAIRIHSGLE